MFERIHQKLGTAGFVISIIALVAALGGGAYAATSNNSGQATASAKQGKQGKPGKPGKTGPAGPAGPAGATGPAGAPGAKGDTGAAGANGTNGTNGTNGKSATVTAIAAGGSKCEGRAGAEVKQEGAASGTAVCEGSPWTAGGTLPAGKTETGNWLLGGFTYVGPAQLAGEISFPIPLAAPSTKVVYLTKSQTENSVTTPIEGCEFDILDSAATPVAPPGTLCVYTGVQEHGEVNSIRASSNAPVETDAPAGAFIFGSPEVFEGATAFFELAGTWAVTAPTS